jgi:Ala-tRNA(Pro) deacylase
MRGEAGLLTDLKALAIPFAAYEHRAVYTVA